MFLENNEKLNDSKTQLTNQLTQVDKTLKRMESQLAVNKSVNGAFQNRIMSLENVILSCWKNEQYSQRECIEIVNNIFHVCIYVASRCFYVVLVRGD